MWRVLGSACRKSELADGNMERVSISKSIEWT